MLPFQEEAGERHRRLHPSICSSTVRPISPSIIMGVYRLLAGCLLFPVHRATVEV